MIIVFTTLPNKIAAESLAMNIIEAKLAACVQVLPPMKSFYHWNNKIHTDTEQLLLIKTLPEKFDELEKFIIKNHDYDLPEIVAVKTERVSDDYFAWLSDYLK